MRLGFDQGLFKVGHLSYTVTVEGGTLCDETTIGGWACDMLCVGLFDFVPGLGRIGKWMDEVIGGVFSKFSKKVFKGHADDINVVMKHVTDAARFVKTR